MFTVDARNDPQESSDDKVDNEYTVAAFKQDLYETSLEVSLMD